MSEKSLIAKVREAGAHTVVYGIGSALQTVLGYVLIPLYTGYFTTELYGVFSLLTLCGTLAGAFFFLGASSALSRSYYDYPEGDERRQVISTSLYLSLVGAAAQCGLGFLLRNELSQWLFDTTEYGPHVAVVLASSAMTFVANVFYIVLRFQRKSWHVVGVNLLSLVATTGAIVYLLVWLKLGVMAPVLGMLVSQALVLAVLFWMCRRFISLRYAKHEIPIQLQFGIPAVFIGLAYYTLDWADRLIINQNATLSEVGIYSLGYKLGIFIHTLFIAPFGQIWAPMQMEYRHDSNAASLYTLIPTYYMMVGLACTVPLSVFSREFTAILARQHDYLIAWRIVAPVMLAHLVYGSLNVINNGIMFERKVMYLVYIFWGGVALNVGLNYWLVPRFGYEAAAYTKLASYLVLAALVYVFSNKLYPVHLEGGRLARLVAGAVITIVIGVRIDLGTTMPTLAARAAVCLAFFASMLVAVLNGNEKAKLRALIGSASLIARVR